MAPTPTKGRRLGGGPAHERLLLANLATALFENDRITTTEAKAKRLRPLVERLVTFAKRGDLHSRRRVMTVVRDKTVVHRLFDEIAPDVADRQGRYTRITKIGPRKGDNAPMVVIELVREPVAKKATVKEAEAATKRAEDDASSVPTPHRSEVSRGGRSSNSHRNTAYSDLVGRETGYLSLALIDRPRTLNGLTEMLEFLKLQTYDLASPAEYVLARRPISANEDRPIEIRAVNGNGHVGIELIWAGGPLTPPELATINDWLDGAAFHLPTGALATKESMVKGMVDHEETLSALHPFGWDGYDGAPSF